MATHSRVLAWRIPGTGEPGGLPSMGSHRVGYDWSDSSSSSSSSSPTTDGTCAPCGAARSPNHWTTGEVPRLHVLNNETGFRKMEQSTQVPQVELIHFDDFKAHTLILTALDLAYSHRPSKKMTHMYPLPPRKKSSHVLLYKYYSERDHQNTHLFLSKDHFQASSSCLF